LILTCSCRNINSVRLREKNQSLAQGREGGRGRGGGLEGVEGVRTRRKFAITAEILARSLANFHC